MPAVLTPGTRDTPCCPCRSQAPCTRSSCIKGSWWPCVRTGLDIKSCPQVKTSASRLELQMPQTDSIVGEAGATTHALRLPHQLKNKDHQGRATSFAEAKGAQRTVAFNRPSQSGCTRQAQSMACLLGRPWPAPFPPLLPQAQAATLVSM